MGFLPHHRSPAKEEEHMTDLRIKQTAAADTATGERFCTQCAQRRPLRTGGEWVASRDGRHRRWKCGDCWVKIKEREKLK